MEKRGHVVDALAAERPAIGASQVRMPVDHEVDRMAVDHPSKFAVAQQPVFGQRFAAKGGAGRGEVGHHDAHVWLQLAHLHQGAVKTRRLSPRPDGKTLGGAVRGRRRALVRPESATRAAHSGQSNANPLENEQASLALEHGRTCILKHLAEGRPPKLAPVVVAENGEKRNPHRPEKLRREFGFRHLSAVGDVARDYQGIGPFVNRGKILDHGGVQRCSDVEITCGGYANHMGPSDVRKTPVAFKAMKILPVEWRVGDQTYTLHGVKPRTVTTADSSVRVTRRLLLALVFLAWSVPWILSGNYVAGAGITEPFADVPRVTAEAVYSFDASTGVGLYAMNAHDRRAPASTTKIATAMVIAENADLSTEVIIDEADVVDANVYSSMQLSAGETLTVEQLLYGLMLPSGNDAALTLARLVGSGLPGGDPNSGGDPVAAFVDAMNRFVVDLGLENTHFTNPAGLDDPDHYSSAHDLAVLGAALLGYPTLVEIVSTPSIVFTPAGSAREYSLFNTNPFLTSRDDVIGIKTGSTENAGGCLVIATRMPGGNQVVTVVMGSDLSYDEYGMIATDTRFDDMTLILGKMDADYQWVAPDNLDAIAGLNDELAAWSVTLRDDSAIVLPTGAGAVDYRLELGPEGDSEAEAGRVLFFVGDQLVAERPVYQI